MVIKHLATKKYFVVILQHITLLTRQILKPSVTVPLRKICELFSSLESKQLAFYGLSLKIHSVSTTINFPNRKLLENRTSSTLMSLHQMM